MKKLIAGNWKMNGSLAMVQTLMSGIARGVKDQPQVLDKSDLLVCPPFPYLSSVGIMLQGAEGIDLGAQDCSDQESGAYTGQVSADMLIDIGAEYVIVGHSERREYCGEDNALLKAKIEQAHAAGLVAIYCVGESEAQREAGQEKDVVSSQLAEGLPEGATAENTVVAYEPVWAIGTGKVATPGDVKDMHGFIRERFAGRILYGGSMKPGNAEELLSTPNVDGGLIGGASLSAEDFLAIASLA